MNTLDERILIPAPPSAVWDHISDLSKNPTWQVDCASISFLTTFHKGSGVRWRYSGKNRRDYVVQITAWYEGLGYEYTYVDGVSYKENKGRIRLQEIPEGTIVQWTFNYEIGGALGGLRDAIGHKRSVNNVMIDSLKKLWLYMKHVDRGNLSREPKSLMREAPDAEARAHYKPRHPSVVNEPQPESEPQPAVSLFTEPPVSDEDTRPRPAVHVDFAPPRPEPTPESEFAPKVGAPGETPAAESEFKKPIVETEAMKAAEEVEPDFVDSIRSSQDMMPAVKEAESAPPVAKEPEVSSAPITVPPVSPYISTPPPLEKPADTVGVDTSKLSVFELFGLPKPSETQEIQAVTSTSLLPVVEKLTIPAPKVEGERRGMRIMMRRKRVKIRRM
jgi:uncharacterized membrane protein